MNKEATLDAVEKTLDEIEPVVDAVADVGAEAVVLVKNNPYILAGVAVVSLAVGGFAGYKLAKKHLRFKFEEIAEREIAEAKEFYSKKYKAEEFSSPEAALKAFGVEVQVENFGYSPTSEEKLVTVPGKPEPVMVQAPVQTEQQLMEVRQSQHADEVQRKHELTEELEKKAKVRNIFADSAPVVDIELSELEQQRATLDPGTPYILTKDEFYNGDKDYEQINLTYFEGDDVLANASDDVIRDTDSRVGDDNLVRFGHGSGEANIVYVRNDRLRIDYEIARSSGSFSTEVLGLGDNDEIQHSQTFGRSRRFRNEE